MWRHFDYDAVCEVCGWEAHGCNALGLAAQHHDRTGHSVGIDVTGHVSYLSAADHAAKLAEKESSP